jgi:hypothetical protein
MRKKKWEITDPQEVEAILRQEKVVRVAFSKDNRSYIVPMNYGYAYRKIYCHTGYAGLKMEYLKVNPHVCIEVDRGVKIIAKEKACQFSCHYESVVGFGTAKLVEREEDKVAAFTIIMNQLTANNDWDFDSNIVKMTAIIEIELTELFGRRSQD